MFNWVENESLNISDVKYNKNSLHIWNKENLNYKDIFTIGPGLVELKENINIQENQILKFCKTTIQCQIFLFFQRKNYS